MYNVITFILHLTCPSNRSSNVSTSFEFLSKELYILSLCVLPSLSWVSFLNDPACSGFPWCPVLKQAYWTFPWLELLMGFLTLLPSPRDGSWCSWIKGNWLLQSFSVRIVETASQEKVTQTSHHTVKAVSTKYARYLFNYYLLTSDEPAGRCFSTSMSCRVFKLRAARPAPSKRNCKSAEAAISDS